MGYRKYFLHVIKEKYPDSYNSVLSNTESKYEEISKDISFAPRSKNPLDRRLEFVAFFLALIQELELLGVGYEEIRNTCLDITSEYVRPKNNFQKWMKTLPPKLVNTWIAKYFLKELDKRIGVKQSHLGFEAKVIFDKKETYGFGYGLDILECGICKLFEKHKADKYKTILCEVDKLTSNIAGLELIRKGTIASGASKCDFRYKLKIDPIE